MSEQTIHNYYQQIISLINKSEFKNALILLKEFLNETSNGELINSCDQISESYNYMLEYMKNGFVDPERNKLYHSLKARAIQLANQARYKLLIPTSNHLFFESIRSHSNNEMFLSNQEILDILTISADARKEENQESKVKSSAERKRENAMYALFRKAWTNYPWDVDFYNYMQELITNPSLLYFEKSIAISAATLSTLDIFDLKKVIFLLEAARNNDLQVSQRAIVGIVLVCWKYQNSISLYPEIKERIDALLDDADFAKSITNIHLQILRGSLETKKITKMMNEEIIPEMMKKANKSGFMRNMIDEDDDGASFNPEWDKDTDDDITKKIQLMGELQMEGADVYLSTFAQLKSFPFFRDISHWFYPFDTKQSDVDAMFSAEPKGIVDLIINAKHICNSDKYSFCFTLGSMPTEHKKMMQEKISSESEAMEMQKENQVDEKGLTAKAISNQYIQDLYRFYKLFPRRQEFLDIFNQPLFFNSKDIFPVLLEEDHLENIFNYLFRKEFYKEALSVFALIQENVNKSSQLINSAEHHQKAGFCCQKLKDYKDAITFYQLADLKKPDNKWTLKNLAICYRNTLQFKKALYYYNKLEEINPSNTNTLYNVGICLAEIQEYKKALQYFFRTDLIKEGIPKVSRAIGWYSFLCGKKDQAQKYTERTIKNKPIWQDYLNLGHILWSKGEIKGAIVRYQEALSLSNNNKEFMTQFLQDEPYLVNAGIAENEIPLMIDLLQ